MRADQAATSIVEYAPAVLPLIVATPEYTAAVAGPLLGPDPAPGALRSIQQQRIQHQELLYGHHAEVVLVIEASVLHPPAGRHPAMGPDVLARQRDRLLALARLPGLSLEVRPPRGPASQPAAIALVIHDDRSAIVGGSMAGEHVNDPADVAGWAQVVAGYRDQALRGEQARAHLRHPHPGRPAA